MEIHYLFGLYLDKIKIRGTRSYQISYRSSPSLCVSPLTSYHHHHNANAPEFIFDLLSPDRCSAPSRSITLLFLSPPLLPSPPSLPPHYIITTFFNSPPPIHSFLFPFSDLLFSASLLLGLRLSLNNRVCLHLARFFFYLLQPTLLPSLSLITLLCCT